MIGRRGAQRFLCMLTLGALAACGDGAGPKPMESRVVPPETDAAPEHCLEVHSAEDAAPCRCTSDCQEGALCIPEAPAIAGGLCRRGCDKTACPSGYACNNRICERNCSATSDCGRARVCADGVCRPFCTRDSDCNAGVCNHWSGDCVASTDEIKGAGIGEPCLVGSECKSDLCSKSDGVCVSSCSVSEQSCPDDAVCANTESDPSADMGLCFVPCNTDGSCERGTCVPLPAPPGAQVCVPPGNRGCMFEPGTAKDGSPCGCDLDCAADGGCWDEANYGFPKGACNHECQTSADCGKGLACNGLGFCSTECKAHQDCRDGYVCGFNHACQPLCQRNSDCANGTCDLYTGRCIAARKGAGIGAPCKADRDCRSNFCDTEYYAIGFCISVCSTELQLCPEGGVCHGTTTSGDLGFCAPTCKSKADCPQAEASCQPNSSGPMYCD